MSLSRGCIVRTRCVAGVARLAALAVALSLAACASDEAARREALAQAQAQRAHALAQRQAEAELEDDGLPSQVPPPVRRRTEPDDPREPFSPNYGAPPTPPSPASVRQRAAAIAPASGPNARRSATY